MYMKEEESEQIISRDLGLTATHGKSNNDIFPGLFT